MAKRRTNPYARAYSFGTDGNAALAGSPIASHRPMAIVDRKAVRRQKGLYVPRWLLLSLWAVFLLVLMLIYGNVAEQGRNIEREMQNTQVDIAAQRQEISSLQREIEQMSDETRIRSIAANRLGMQQPKEEQIVSVARPALGGQEATGWTPPQTDGWSFLRTLLGMLGL